MQLFYCPEISRGVHILPEAEATHCLRVLRNNTGDEIDITDGAGHLFKALITQGDMKKCTFSIISTIAVQRPKYRIHIAISPTKSPERMEWFVEKAVEIGAKEITFFRSEHSERSHFSIDRALKKAISAMKQSERAFLPELHEMTTLEKVFQLNIPCEKFIAHLEGDETQQLGDVARKNVSYLILIGPEGGFSDAELTKAKSKGFIPVKLGNHRLRTETAGVVACTLLEMINL